MPATLVNGTHIFYKIVGEGLPCLIMHGGLGIDHTYLHPWLDYLSDVLQLVYYDHRGNGRSGRPPVETLTLEQLASDADVLRETLGFQRIAILGHSAGGFIALTYALAYPERVSHLILVDTAASFDYADGIIANAKNKGANEDIMAALEAPNPSDDEGFRRMLEVIMPVYFYRFDRSLADRLFANTIFNASASIADDVYDTRLQLSDIHAPTLILVGADDFICPPSQAEIIHRGIPDSEMVLFNQSGHLPYVEEPEQFFAAIRSWLSRHR